MNPFFRRCLLSLLLLGGLLTTAEGQVVKQKFKRVRAGLVQRGTVLRDLAQYPKGSGDAAFNAAVNSISRPFAITLTSGEVLPALSTPPVSTTTTPTSGTTATGFSQTLEAEAAAGGNATYDKNEASGNKIRDGELTYTLTNVPQAGSYTLTLVYQSNQAVPVLGITLNGGSTQSVTLLATDGGLTTYAQSVTLQAGTNTLKIGPLTNYVVQDKITVTK